MKIGAYNKFYGHIMGKGQTRHTNKVTKIKTLIIVRKNF